MIPGGLVLDVSDYRGHEEEVLAVRNRNRSQPVNRAYLDWRYLGEQASREPFICWLRDGSGRGRGMMAVVGRSYVLDGRRIEVGVVGDIALDTELRGSGVARFLVDGVEKTALQQGWGRMLVLPNLPAEGLFKNRWCRVSELGRWVLPLRPFGSRRAWNQGWTCVLSHWLKTRLWKGLSLTAGSTQTVWERCRKAGMVLRDRSASVLEWRYASYPLRGMKLREFIHRDRAVGWIVEEFDARRGVLSLQDACFVENRWAEPCMAAYALDVMERDDVRSLWMLMSTHHVLRPVVRKLGFLRRGDWTGVFTWGETDKVWSSPASWQVLDGDKDA